MKLQLDLPRSYDDPDHAEHLSTVRFYDSVLRAAVLQGIEVGVKRAVLPELGLDEATRLEPEDGADLRYAFHSLNMGPGVFCLKSSPLPGFWQIDPHGYSGWSRLATDLAYQTASSHYDLDEAERHIAWHRARYVEQNASKFAQPDRDAEPVPEPGYLFYPLQTNGDRVLDLFRWSQADVLERLSQLADRTERRVVVKRHPKCSSPFLAADIARHAGHRFLTFSTASVHPLIQNARAVLVGNSGVGLEALIHGKPVHTMAASEYRHMTTAVESLDDLEQVFEAEPAPQSERIRRQLGFLLGVDLLADTDGTAIGARIAEHFGGAAALDTPHADSLQRALTMSAALRKALAERVDWLARIQEPVEAEVRLLVQAATLGIERRRILRQASAEVCLLCARALVARDQPGPAALFLDRAEAELAHRATFHLVRARLARARGDDAAELAAMEAAAEASDAGPQDLYRIARAHWNAGHFVESAQWAERAVRSDNSLGLAHWLVARGAERRGDSAEALRSMSVAHRLMPDHPTIARDLKRLKSRSG